MPRVRGAQKYEQRLLNKINDGGSPDAGTLAEFVPEFMRCAELHNSPSEVHTKERHLRRHLVPALGHLELDAIGPTEIDAFAAAQVAAGFATKTVNNHLAILARMLTLAEERGKIARAPKVRLLETKIPDVSFLSFDEADRLVAKTSPEWRAVVLTGLRTGLRLGELRALRWSDVDLQHA